MMGSNRQSQNLRDWPSVQASAQEEMDAIRGTIQRVDYRRREVRVIAKGRAWRFVVADNCRLSFNGTPAILRCFHPLDRVTVIFRGQETDNLAVAILSQPEEGTESC